jgi:hypothetical protein
VLYAVGEKETTVNQISAGVSLLAVCIYVLFAGVPRLIHNFERGRVKVLHCSYILCT